MANVKDGLGNIIDSSVSYARGKILGGLQDETLRLRNGRRLIRERILSQGRDAIFNLTALTRAFPIEKSDVDRLETQFEFYAHFDGSAEESVVRFHDGDPGRHQGFIMNRISSAMIAIMSALIEPGDTVVSIVPRGRSHPSVERGVRLARGVFRELQGIAGATEAAALRPRPKLVVVTPLTHAKFHMEHSDFVQIIRILKAAGLTVMADDAHVAARKGIYGEPGSLHYPEVDLAIFSPDKHMMGPRAGALAGRKDLVEKISGFSFGHGIDAQSSHVAAVQRSIEKYDPTDLAAAGVTAKELLRLLQERYGQDSAYSAGPGIGMSEETIMRIAMMRRPGCNVAIVPIEGASVICMWLLEKYGVVTIPSVGMPGSSPALRFMIYPDGPRFGVKRIVQVLDEAIDVLAGVLNDPARAEQIILGPYVRNRVDVA